MKYGKYLKKCSIYVEEISTVIKLWTVKIEDIGHTSSFY